MTSPTFYLRIFATAFFPWSIVVIGGLVDIVVQRRHPPMPAEVRVLWLWLFVVIGFFTVARFKLDHYIFPMAPACCLLAARAWRTAAVDDRWHWTRVSIGVIAAVMVVGGLVASVALFRINLGLDVSALTLPLALVAGGCVLGFQMIRRRGLPPLSIWTPIVTLVAAYGVFVVIGLPILEQSRPTAPLDDGLQNTRRRRAAWGSTASLTGRPASATTPADPLSGWRPRRRCRTFSIVFLMRMS
jgi:4-amino-4-deoxy-L-arabinose transferase-like glycosyltransferase